MKGYPIGTGSDEGDGIKRRNKYQRGGAPRELQVKGKVKVQKRLSEVHRKESEVCWRQGRRSMSPVWRGA